MLELFFLCHLIQKSFSYNLFSKQLFSLYIIRFQIAPMSTSRCSVKYWNNKIHRSHFIFKTFSSLCICISNVTVHETVVDFSIGPAKQASENHEQKQYCNVMVGSGIFIFVQPAVGTHILKIWLYMKS